MNKTTWRFVPLMLAGVLSASLAAEEMRRLSPVPVPSKVPAECRIASVLKDSPAEKAGLAAGDVLVAVNGQAPADASGLADLVGSAPSESDFRVRKAGAAEQTVRIVLHAARPRLGAVCDLAGMTKPGVTAAGNESITLFNGPFSFTVSGILDKGITFLRLRVSNDSPQALAIGPDRFRVTDAAGQPMAILTPKEVMCRLYGEKGAHLLALKKKRKESMDTHEGLDRLANEADEKCEGVSVGTLRGGDSEYAEANAQYLAAESLWPATYQPGSVADGLIYLPQPNQLPITIQGAFEGRTLQAQLGLPRPSAAQMSRSDLATFFEGRKKGASIRVTLNKGKVFVGKFSSYDAIEERVWFSTPAGFLNTTSFSLDMVRSAEALEPVPPKPNP